MLGTLLRQVQAEQRKLRTEQATIRDLIAENRTVRAVSISAHHS
jgi:hypothetical protein